MVRHADGSCGRWPREMPVGGAGRRAAHGFAGYERHRSSRPCEAPPEVNGEVANTVCDFPRDHSRRSPDRSRPDRRRRRLQTRRRQARLAVAVRGAAAGTIAGIAQLVVGGFVAVVHKQLVSVWSSKICKTPPGTTLPAESVSRRVDVGRVGDGLGAEREVGLALIAAAPRPGSRSSWGPWRRPAVGTTDRSRTTRRRRSDRPTARSRRSPTSTVVGGRDRGDERLRLVGEIPQELQRRLHGHRHVPGSGCRWCRRQCR